MAKYRKLPVVIDAVKFTGSNQAEVLRFIYPDLSESALTGLQGHMTASPGDFVIKGVKGEFYPCKPEIFEATYELAE